MDIRSAGQKGDFGTAISGGMESTSTGLAVGTLNLQIAESDSSIRRIRPNSWISDRQVKSMT